MDIASDGGYYPIEYEYPKHEQEAPPADDYRQVPAESAPSVFTPPAEQYTGSGDPVDMPSVFTSAPVQEPEYNAYDLVNYAPPAEEPSNEYIAAPESIYTPVEGYYPTANEYTSPEQAAPYVPAEDIPDPPADYDFLPVPENSSSPTPSAETPIDFLSIVQNVAQGVTQSIVNSVSSIVEAVAGNSAVEEDEPHATSGYVITDAHDRADKEYNFYDRQDIIIEEQQNQVNEFINNGKQLFKALGIQAEREKKLEIAKGNVTDYFTGRCWADKKYDDIRKILETGNLKDGAVPITFKIEELNRNTAAMFLERRDASNKLYAADILISKSQLDFDSSETNESYIVHELGHAQDFRATNNDEDASLDSINEEYDNFMAGFEYLKNVYGRNMLVSPEEIYDFINKSYAIKNLPQQSPNHTENPDFDKD